MMSNELRKLAESIETARGLIALARLSVHDSLSASLQLGEEHLEDCLDLLEEHVPELGQARERRRRMRRLEELIREGGTSRADLVAFCRQEWGWSGSTARRRISDTLKAIKDSEGS